jgi:hypothetical protein
VTKLRKTEVLETLADVGLITVVTQFAFQVAEIRL